MKKITGYVKLQIQAGKANPPRLSVLLSVSTASISWSSARRSMPARRTWRP